MISIINLHMPIKSMLYLYIQYAISHTLLEDQKYCKWHTHSNRLEKSKKKLHEQMIDEN